MLAIGLFVRSRVSPTEILDGRVHLCHTDDVRDSSLSGDKTDNTSASFHFISGKTD